MTSMKLAMVEPTYLSAKVPNNKWMEDMTDEERQVNLPVAYQQWFNLYSLLTQGATVYLVPPKPQYQDQCYDGVTEVYTRSGWKKFKDVTLEDEILSLNPKTLEMEYVRPIRKQEYPYSGKMFHFIGKEVDLRVTEDHNILYLHRVKGHPDKYIIRFAKPSTLPKNLGFPSKGGNFTFSTTPSEIVFEEYRGENGRTYPKRVFKAEDWFSFVGWYLSEGSSGQHNKHYHVCISQTIYAEEIKQLLERMDLPYYFDGRDFEIADKRLYEFFKQFGKAEEKFIPREMQDSIYLPYLIDSLLKGDGNKSRTEYYTKSKRLADDVQAALIKLGFRANIRRNKDGSYVVHFSKKNSWCRNVIVEEVQNEMVYDVTLPKNHIMLVRRNGKAVWSGNCYVVNAGIVLPHLQLYQNRNVCVLSKFKAEARPGEELELKKLVEELGYETYQCPYYFEGEAECYDEETEILTEKGWKFFKDLDATDLVMTYDPISKTLYFQKPIAYQKYFFDGELIRLKNRYIDALVTPDHNVFLKTTTGNLMFAKASVLPKNFYLIITGVWKPHREVREIIPEFLRDKISIETWLKFLGWYLSEGYVNFNEEAGNYQIWICQNRKAHPEKYQEIEELLKNMGFSVSHGENGLIVYSKELAQYLKQFGQANSKFIPQEIKQLDPSLLRILIDAMMKGDGHNSKKSKYYSTSSKQLADDFQEICLKCGIPAFIGFQYKTLNGKTFLTYRVYIRKAKQETVFHQFIPEKVRYKGFVYDVTVPENHILLVRRHGKPFLSGNCKWLNENVYIGGYGIRTSKRAHAWLEEQFGCKIIPVETDEWLYHLDCLVFPISNDYCIICEDIPQDTKDQIKKYTNVIEVPYDNCLEGITNSFRLNSYVLNADVSKSVTGMQALKQIKSEQQKLTEICADLGLTPVFIDLSEFLKSGALLSCMILHLTWEECWLG